MAAQETTKGKTAANAIFFVVLAIAIAGVVNLLASRKFTRFDLTSEKVYTLSPASKELVKNLPDRLNVKLFMSEDLKPPFKSHATFVRDLLADYAAYSGGKMVVEVIRIGEGDTKKEEEAARYKVRKSSRGVLSANKVEIGASYLGVGFDYHGQIESIPIIETDQGLEFEISGIIKQLTVKKKKIAFSSGQGELSLGHGGASLLDQQLKKAGYDTTSLELKAKIPDDVDALVVAGPKTPMSERAKYVLDQFLMKGRAVAIFLDGQVMEMPRGMMMPGMDMPQIARSNDAGMDDLLEHYGFKVRGDIVLDSRQNYIGPVTVGQQVLGINHPVFLVAGPLEQNHPITAGIEAIILPYASSMELVGALKDGKGPIQVWKLAESSKYSWRPAGPFVFDPRGARMAEGAERGPFPLAYAAQGKFTSFFKGKQIVKEDGTKVDANVSQPDVEPMITEATQPARLVVVGDSDFVSDQYTGLAARGLQAYIADLAFAMNIIDWLAQDEALAQVRNKGMQNRPLKAVGEGMVTLIKAVNIFGMPLLLVVIGLVRWRVRRAARRIAHL
ncbi:MAG: Gldg family protein [Myxococcales bacterium]|nr:Gldg family protein [Myxococcota bacterium]MDW8283918.1 Gldg family protein [Myxococcales bacterium]